MKRLVYLDVLRGIAILLMVIDHAYDWWLDASGHATRLAAITRLLGTLAAPLFLYLVGVGLALSALKSRQTGQKQSDVVQHLILRGAKLILWGYVLNLAVFFVGGNTSDILAVDILQVIGVSIWLLVPFLWSPTWLVAVATAVFAIVGQTAGSWVLPDWIAAYVTGTGGIGYFPLALWLPYAHLGLAVGKEIARAGRPQQVMRVLVIGGVLALAAIPCVDPGWGYRHPRPVFVLFSLAILFGFTTAVWLWTDRLDRRGPVVAALRDMGLSSLMLYVFHHLIGYRLFWLLGWVNGRSWRGANGVFGPICATLLLGCLLSLMTAAAHLWVSWQTPLRSWMAKTAKGFSNIAIEGPGTSERSGSDSQ